MLSKKYYEDLAVLLGANPDRRTIIEAFSEYLAAENPRFDPKRFRAAISRAEVVSSALFEDRPEDRPEVEKRTQEMRARFGAAIGLPDISDDLEH